MNNFPQSLRVAIFNFGIWCLFVIPAWAAQPSITKVALNTEKGLITLTADLAGAFNEKIREAIESGVAMTFTYEIEFLKHSSVFGDEVISENKVTHTVQYDTLKKVYQFSSQGKKCEPEGCHQKYRKIPGVDAHAQGYSRRSRL